MVRKLQMTRSWLVNPSPRSPYAWRISRWWSDFVFTRPAYRFTTAGSATPNCPPRSLDGLYDGGRGAGQLPESLDCSGFSGDADVGV
jgi:hypothetical protein